MIDRAELKEILAQHRLDGGKRADLQWADLRGANLQGANLIVMQIWRYRVYVQKDFTRIGCEYHNNGEWLAWEPEDVKHMAYDAEDFWKQYKAIICAAIESISKR